MKLSNAVDAVQTIDTNLLFNVRICENIVNSLISTESFPCMNYIYHINNLLMKSNFSKKDNLYHKRVLYENKEVFRNYVEFLNVKINEQVLFDNSNCLISRFSCVNLIERILKYGNFKNNIITEFDDELLTKIILLNIFETEIDEESNEYESKNNLLNLSLSIITYNQFSNNIFNSNFFRLSYIYNNYIHNNTEINSLFRKSNGYSIKNYLLFIQLFFLLGSKVDTKVNYNNLNNSTDAKEIKKCFKEHVFDFKSENEKRKIVIDSYIPSRILIDKPIISFENGYLIINSGLLIDRIYGIFFQKIKSSINNNRLFNSKFYGTLFEKYCRDIARNYTLNSKYKYYNFIEPFKYTIGNDQKDSSDFYINYNDTTIIFEIKSTQRFIETTVDVSKKRSNKYIKEEVDYKIVTPLKQIENRLSEILSLNSTLYPKEISMIQKSLKYYYIIVSDETIINNYLFYNDYLSKLKCKFSTHIPLYLNISEFECLMMSLYKRKKSIDKVIEYYYNNYFNSNFFAMILKEKKNFKFDKLDIFEKRPFDEELKKILN